MVLQCAPKERSIGSRQALLTISRFDTGSAWRLASYVDEQMYNSFVLHPNTLVAYNSDKVKNWTTTRSEYYMLTNELDVE